jgi:lysophospholipase L1-like esterase
MARWRVPAQLLPDPPPPITLDPVKPNPYIVKMRPYLYSHIPGSVYTQARAGFKIKYEINAHGFRGPEIPVPKPKDRKRLLVLGDSVIEGYGNEFTQAFPYLLDKNLRASGWEVINVGVQGASPIYYAANTDRYLSLQPDAVLLVLYQNDLFEDRVREVEYFNLPFLENTDKLLRQSTLVGILARSRAYMVLYREWRERLMTPVEQIANQNRISWPANHEQSSLFLESPQLVPLSFVDQQWALSRPYLDHVVSEFHEHQFQLLVTNLSSGPMHPDSLFQPHARHLDGLIAAWTQEKELPFLSLLPVMTQVYTEKHPSEILIVGDGHPTPATHALIAAALSPWLLEQLHEE